MATTEYECQMEGEWKPCHAPGCKNPRREVIRYEKTTRAERDRAIRSVLGMARSIESEYGSCDWPKAYERGKNILIALGIPQTEIPEYEEPEFL
jgi:hypothetical protein